MWGLPQPLIPLWSSGLDFGRAIFFDYVDSTNAPRLAAGGFGKSIRRQSGQTWATRLVSDLAAEQSVSTLAQSPYQGPQKSHEKRQSSSHRN